MFIPACLNRAAAGTAESIADRDAAALYAFSAQAAISMSRSAVRSAKILPFRPRAAKRA